MVPQGYVETREGRVLLADSEVPILVDGLACYRTGYAVQRERLWWGNYHDYPASETGGSRSERDARLNEAVSHARMNLAITVKGGLYDDARKNDFSTLQH